MCRAYKGLGPRSGGELQIPQAPDFLSGSLLRQVLQFQQFANQVAPTRDRDSWGPNLQSNFVCEFVELIQKVLERRTRSSRRQEHSVGGGGVERRTCMAARDTRSCCTAVILFLVQFFQLNSSRESMNRHSANEALRGHWRPCDSSPRAQSSGRSGIVTRPLLGARPLGLASFKDPPEPLQALPNFQTRASVSKCGQV